jgi:hypothetical protein
MAMNILGVVPHCGMVWALECDAQAGLSTTDVKVSIGTVKVRAVLVSGVLPVREAMWAREGDASALFGTTFLVVFVGASDIGAQECL